jgi:predicted  nucleic acid-binding Zn-ribbon protein
MSKLSLPLLAIALALALTATPAGAQQITTSQGVRTLPRVNPAATAVQLNQNARSAEEILQLLVRDIDAIEKTRGAAVGDAGGLTDRVKRESAEYERAKTAFQTIDQKYRDDLASFQQRQARLEADVQQQRSQSEVLQALPSAQRDINEVMRLNDWATKLGTERQAIDADRNRLLADHEHVEKERVKLEKQRTDAEARLKSARDSTVGHLNSTEQKRTAAYAQLRTVISYLRGVGDQLTRVSTTKVQHSQVFDEANAKLLSYESRARAK